MTRGKAEDAGGLTPAKDDNAAPYHFDRRTLPIFKCVDYICRLRAANSCRGLFGQSERELRHLSQLPLVMSVMGLRFLFNSAGTRVPGDSSAGTGQTAPAR